MISSNNNVIVRVMESDSTNILYVSNVSRPEDLKKIDKCQMWQIEIKRIESCECCDNVNDNDTSDFVKIHTSLKKSPTTVLDSVLVSNLFNRFSATYLMVNFKVDSIFQTTFTLKKNSALLWTITNAS